MRLLRDIAERFKQRAPSTRGLAPWKRRKDEAPRVIREIHVLEDHLPKRVHGKPFKRAPMDRAFMGIVNRPTREVLAKCKGKKP